MIKTYPFSDPNPVPTLTTNTAIYPYHTFDGYTQTGQEQPWKVVTLENDYIRVSLLPQVGGKVWGAIEKSTGEDFIYQNEVLKFRNIAMRGPWTSGGIEFNFGIIGHSPTTATPVNYIIQKHDDGSVSCIVGTIDLPSRTQWRVRVTLSPDQAYFETNSLWYNGDQPATSQPYLQKVIEHSPAFVFPFRRESLAALEWAKEQQAHWKMDYYLGLVYWAVGRTEEAAAQFTACGDTPDYAPFYLAWASLLRKATDQDEISDINRALALDESQWHPWHQLLDYYDQHNRKDEAQATAQQAYQRFPDRYVIGMDYARALFHGEQYKQAAQVLKELQILPYEGASEGQTVFEQVHLRWAMQQLQKKQYASAVKLLETSLDWPENLGVGKPYDPDTRPQNYLLAHCYRRSNKTKLAQQHLQQVIDYTRQRAERSPYDLLAVLALQRQGKTDEASRWLEAMKDKEDDPLVQWAVAYATDQNETITDKALTNNETYISLRQMIRLVER